MAKEDLLLHEEMGRLEIEPIDIKKERSKDNPFGTNSTKKYFTLNGSCCCLSQKLKNKTAICKKKHNKILKEPVMKIIKICVDPKDVKRGDTNYSTENALNLCTLVKNCNQLKISSGSKEQTVVKCENKWWKNDNVTIQGSRDPKATSCNQVGSCSQQALNPPCDVTIDELASYFETLVHIPKKMSSMAEMMYI